MPDEFLHALMDPIAPLRAAWPNGALGAFLLFLMPVGTGIPAGVLMAREAGTPAPLTTLLYLLSDIFIALTREPLFWALQFLGRWIPTLGRFGQWLVGLSGNVGLRSGVRGPLSLIMVSFTTSPTFGRAVAAAAGHGFVSGWALAITGDMLYFILLMVSTLFLSSVLGDERLTVGIVFGIMLLAPLVFRGLRGQRRPVGPDDAHPSRPGEPERNGSPAPESFPLGPGG